MVLAKLKLVSIADILTISNGICGILAIIAMTTIQAQWRSGGCGVVDARVTADEAYRKGGPDLQEIFGPGNHAGDVYAGLELCESNCLGINQGGFGCAPTNCGIGGLACRKNAGNLKVNIIYRGGKDCSTPDTGLKASYSLV